MLKDITLGQYFPGDTVIHRLDPRTKIVMVGVFLVALFSSGGLIPMLIPALFLAMVIALSKVRVRLLIRNLKPLIIILSFTGFINLFMTPGEPLVSVWIFTVTLEGIERAVVLVTRIVMMIMGTFILTYTTTPMTLTDGIESLMSPLKWLRVPVHELTIIMSMALRFIPALIEETDKIMSAQKARGADFETGNLLKRAKALIPLLIPLFISAIRRAEELAIAMESRCYHGGEGRTRMRQLQFAARDFLTGLVGVLLLVAVFGIRGLLQ
ncbi:MAG: energy-coupling factor transporter transmembrane protein EcfT [Oscillospiraceae bacterium]|nr:energy-coupling factor transporter transmembrane protein EcfT [Oscillospiraceae bacterium]